MLGATDLNGSTVGPSGAGQVTAVLVFASWCRPCRNEIAMLGNLIQEEPRLRVIGVNYYEEQNDNSDEDRLRSFVTEKAPWLQVVRADEKLMDGLGRPSKVPTVFLFDGRGRLMKAFLRSRRKPATKEELKASIAAITAEKAE